MDPATLHSPCFLVIWYSMKLVFQSTNQQTPKGSHCVQRTHAINKSPNQSALPNTVHPADELAEAKPSAGARASGGRVIQARGGSHGKNTPRGAITVHHHTSNSFIYPPGRTLGQAIHK